ncbi:Hsp20/alpha crystallin family protein [Chitinophagaceae bacterium MMS25-I14]
MYNQQSGNFKEKFRGGCGHMGGRGFQGGWGNPWAHYMKRHFGMHRGNGSVPVNIEETDSSFILKLYAAGLRKEDFKIAVKDDMLTIAYGNEGDANKTSDESRNYTHREFSGDYFERSFQLNGKVLTDGITANYADGVLTVTLPKDPETNKPAQNINVQ